jgi:hypothetical protein
MLTFGCSEGVAGICSCGGSCGVFASFASAAPPAIEVSGTPAFRGGGWGYSDEGRYAVAVCICRLADCRDGIDEAKVRAHCGHLRGVPEGAANRRNVELERAKAAVVRGSDMVKGRVLQGVLRVNWVKGACWVNRWRGTDGCIVTKFAEAYVIRGEFRGIWHDYKAHADWLSLPRSFGTSELRNCKSHHHESTSQAHIHTVFKEHVIHAISPIHKIVSVSRLLILWKLQMACSALRDRSTWIL